MRPNFTFGPLDSVSQYLLYLSIVVLGVILPFLLQKWHERRRNAELAAQTCAALRSEIEANRKRANKSLTMLRGFKELLVEEKLFLDEHWRRVIADDAAGLSTSSPNIVHRETTAMVSYPVMQTTAWEVARHADALRLLPRETLTALTLLYRGHTAYDEARSMALAISVRSNAMDLPIDLSARCALESRMELIAHLLSSNEFLCNSLEQLDQLFEEGLKSLAPART